MPSSNSCQLTAIKDLSDLRQLRALYQKDWPTHCVGYYCLDNFIRWLEREPELKNLCIYTLDNNWQSDGLFLVVDRYQLFVNSLAKSDNQLLIKAISLLDWSNGYKVSSFAERHRAAVLKVVLTKELTLKYDSLTVMYYMPRNEAMSLNVHFPTEYLVRPLSIDNAKFVNEHWPNRHRGSLFLIQRLIAWNKNMGIFTKSTNELVAWCLRLQGGFLGALQVMDSHKRLGLGSLVTSATARAIAEMGHDVMALVNKDNIPSRSLFERLNFKLIDNCYWLQTLPTVEGNEWPDGE